MEKVRPWCGQPSDRARLKIRSDQVCKSDSTSSLLSYPAVAEAFRKSNATLPSSAAVERLLISAASQVLCDRRCRMFDETLNKLAFVQSTLK